MAELDIEQAFPSGRFLTQSSPTADQQPRQRSASGLDAAVV
jgi:hypothetical protein